MINTVSNLASTATELASPALVNFTKILNEVGTPNKVDIYMDFVKGVGHRVKHGHDISSLPVIFDKFGWDGIAKFTKHLLIADIMSPHGIPILPYTHEIGKLLGLSTKAIVDWMCINIGDVLSGSLAIANSYLNYKLITTSSPDGQKLTLILISSGIKLVASTVNPNPITFLSSLFDIGLVAYAGTPVLLDHFFPKYSLKLSLLSSVKAGSIALTANALFLCAREFHQKKRFKDIDYKMIAKESSIAGVSVSVASITYDTSKYYITQNEIANMTVSICAFAGAKKALKSFFTSTHGKYVKNSSQIVDISLIPAF